MNQGVGVVAQHLHKEPLRVGLEDGGKLFGARRGVLFEQGRVGGDAFEDTEVAVTLNAVRLAVSRYMAGLRGGFAAIVRRLLSVARRGSGI